MKEPFIDDGLLINPKKRCIYCKALEIIDIDSASSNLMETDKGVLLCADREECERNILSENTLVEVGVSDKDITLTDKYGNEVFLFKGQEDNNNKPDFKNYFGGNNDDDIDAEDEHEWDEFDESEFLAYYDEDDEK